jgi:hypothetical protein
MPIPFGEAGPFSYPLKKTDTNLLIFNYLNPIAIQRSEPYKKTKIKFKLS